MENDKLNFSPDEQLRVIQEMIEKTRKETADNGWSLIMWGWLIIVSIIVSYVLFWKEMYEYSGWPWAIFMATGGVITALVEIKRGKNKKVRTYAERAIGWAWGACGFAMAFIGFVAVPAGILKEYASITPMICLITGIGTIVTSKIIDWNFMFYMSLLWFLSVILMAFIPTNFHLLIMGITIIPAYLTPGYILKYRYKKV